MRVVAQAMAVVSPGSTRKPFWPSATSSGMAPALTAMAGRPLAMASMRTMLWVSVVEGMTKTAAAR